MSNKTGIIVGRLGVDFLRKLLINVDNVALRRQLLVWFEDAVRIKEITDDKLGLIVSYPLEYQNTKDGWAKVDGS